MEAVLNEAGDGIVATGGLRELFPGVNFARGGPSPAWRAANRCFPVLVRLRPGADYDPETEKTVPVAPFILAPGDVRAVIVEPLSADELAAALEVARANAKSVVQSEFVRRRDGGLDLDVDGQGTIVRFATDAAAYQELDALVRRLGRKGGTQKARTRSGAVIEPDLATATAVFEAVDDHIAACWAREAELAAAIDAATSKAEIAAIDISSGWPG